MNEEDQSQTKKKETDELAIITTLSDRIFLYQDEADPSNYFMSCREALDIINDIMKSPFMFNEDKHKVPLKCFACSYTGGTVVLELLINKGIIDVEEVFVRKADLSREISEDVRTYIDRVKEITEPDVEKLKRKFIKHYVGISELCPRKKEISKLSDVRDAYADKLRASAKRVVISSKE